MWFTEDEPVRNQMLKWAKNCEANNKSIFVEISIEIDSEDGDTCKCKRKHDQNAV